MENDKIKEIINTFAKLAKIDDREMLDGLIENLSSRHIDDATDAIIVLLRNLVNRRQLDVNAVFENSDLLLQLNEKYKTVDDLMERLSFLNMMNIVDTNISLVENHELILECFDKFNKLLDNKFDCYYTGGMMGYLATNHPLERYHSDLDLLINEEQLLILKDLVDISDDFEFVSNMNHKEEHGHEYMISYKDKPMSIGLFLFSREKDNVIIQKEYFYRNNNPNDILMVDEQHLSREYSELCFSNNVRTHNNIPYRMMSLESLYSYKMNARPKDRYDCKVIEGSINIDRLNRIEELKKDNYNRRRTAEDSVIHKIENSFSIKDIPSVK